MTLIEMSISLAVFTFVGIFVSYVSLLIARNTKETMSQVPAQQQAYRTMDVVRQRLMVASFDSIVVSTDGQMVTYQNPYETNPSTLEFDPVLKKAIFTQDATQPRNRVEWGRDVIGRFEYNPADPKKITIHVSANTVGRNNEPLTVKFSETITVRN